MFGTFVLRPGEDPAYSPDSLERAIAGIKASTGAAVTSSVSEEPDRYYRCGERPERHARFVATVRDTLASHQAVRVVLPTTDRGILRTQRGSAPEPDDVRVHGALGLPHSIMATIRTWFTE